MGGQELRFSINGKEIVFREGRRPKGLKNAGELKDIINCIFLDSSDKQTGKKISNKDFQALKKLFDLFSKNDKDSSDKICEINAEDIEFADYIKIAKKDPSSSMIKHITDWPEEKTLNFKIDAKIAPLLTKILNFDGEFDLKSDASDNFEALLEDFHNAIIKQNPKADDKINNADWLVKSLQEAFENDDEALVNFLAKFNKEKLGEKYDEFINQMLETETVSGLAGKLGEILNKMNNPEVSNPNPNPTNPTSQGSDSVVVPGGNGQEQPMPPAKTDENPKVNPKSNQDPSPNPTPKSELDLYNDKIQAEAAKVNKEVKARTTDYQVKSSDTLYKIAKEKLGGNPSALDINKYIAEIVAINSIKNANLIYAGTTIKLPEKQVETPAAEPTDNNGSPSAPEEAGVIPEAEEPRTVSSRVVEGKKYEAYAQNDLNWFNKEWSEAKTYRDKQQIFIKYAKKDPKLASSLIKNNLEDILSKVYKYYNDPSNKVGVADVPAERLKACNDILESFFNDSYNLVDLGADALAIFSTLASQSYYSSNEIRGKLAEKHPINNYIKSGMSKDTLEYASRIKVVKKYNYEACTVYLHNNKYYKIDEKNTVSEIPVMEAKAYEIHNILHADQISVKSRDKWLKNLDVSKENVVDLLKFYNNCSSDEGLLEALNDEITRADSNDINKIINAFLDAVSAKEKDETASYACSRLKKLVNDNTGQDKYDRSVTQEMSQLINELLKLF